MAKNFISRLTDYYSNVIDVLKGKSDAASIFPNPTDIGDSRESVYKEFLKLHAPSKCNIYKGGYLFDSDGNESKQIDIIISADSAPQFNFFNHDDSGKTFCPVEGCLGVVSVKSNLDKDQLFDALSNIASIPQTRDLTGRISPTVQIHGYENWPYKVIYSSNGLSGETIMEHINAYYNDNLNIPIYRRPDVIHVLGKYLIVKATGDMTAMNPETNTEQNLEAGKFYIFGKEPDLQGILLVLHEIQQKAIASSVINYSYYDILSKIVLLCTTILLAPGLFFP